MKIKLFFLLFLFFVLSLSAQNENIIRFDLDLEELSSLSEKEVNLLINENKMLIIDGILSSVLHEEDRIILTLLNGKWDGTASVNTYQARVLLDGPSWAEVFPMRLPRNPGSEIIYVNSYLLVLGTPVSYVKDNGQLLVTVTASDLRVVSQ